MAFYHFTYVFIDSVFEVVDTIIWVKILKMWKDLNAKVLFLSKSRVCLASVSFQVETYFSIYKILPNTNIYLGFSTIYFTFKNIILKTLDTW